jgi:hypothetical protein
MQRWRAARLWACEPFILERLEQRLLLTSAEIIGVIPLANSRAAPVGTDITLTYDQNLDGPTVTDQTFAVHRMFTGQLVDPPHGSMITVVGDTIIFNPDNDFDPGELVFVSATTNIQNTGSEVSDKRVWQFRAGVAGGGGLFTDAA